MNNVYNYLFRHRRGEIYWYNKHREEADLGCSFYSDTGYTPNDNSKNIGPISLVRWNDE